MTSVSDSKNTLKFCFHSERLKKIAVYIQIAVSLYCRQMVKFLWKCFFFWEWPLNEYSTNITHQSKRSGLHKHRSVSFEDVWRKCVFGLGY